MLDYIQNIIITNNESVRMLEFRVVSKISYKPKILIQAKQDIEKNKRGT